MLLLLAACAPVPTDSSAESIPFVPASGGFVATAPGADLTLRLDRGGASFGPADTPLHLQLHGWNGPGGLGAPRWTADGDRATADRGPLDEWWTTAGGGVEQGFTLRAGAPGVTELHLAVRGATARVDGDSVVLTPTEGRAVRYGTVSAVDATGRGLDAHTRLDGDELVLAIDTTGATFPVTVDPLLVGFWGSTGTGGFGSAVAIVGDVNGDGFDDAAFGAPGYDGTSVNQGAAYVYLGHRWGLDLAADWSVEGGQLAAAAGTAVAGAGDVDGDGYDDVLVGVPGYDHGTTDEGRALLYLGSASGLATTESWSAEGEQAQAGFGTVVCGLGDVDGDGYADVALGVPAWDDGEADEGAIFVYRGGPGGPSTTADWVFTSDQASAGLGTAVLGVDLDGDGYSDLVGGAPGWDDSKSNEGIAWVWYGSASGLSATPTWSYSYVNTGASTGSSLAAGDLDGDGHPELLVGESGGGSASYGGISIFAGSATGPATSVSKLVSSSSSGSKYGETGGLAYVGDFSGDGLGDFAAKYGSYIYVYHGVAGLSVSTKDTLTSGASSDGFGLVGSGGDLDGDGRTDLVVGAPSASSSAGAAYAWYAANGDVDGGWSSTSNHSAYGVYLVRNLGDFDGDGDDDIVDAVQSSGLSDCTFWLDYPNGGLSTSGADSIACKDTTSSYDADAIDLNGDGYSDLLFFYSSSLTEYFGGASGLDTTLSASVTVNRGNTYGDAVGDFDGDGHPDLFTAYAASYSSPGSKWVFTKGTASGLSTQTSTSTSTNLYEAHVHSAGDVDGDGYDDAVVTYYSTLTVDWLRGGVGGPTLVSWGVTGSLYAGARGVGDVNADGFDDLGVPHDNVVDIYFGSATGPGTTPDVTLTAPSYSEVNQLGDVNGDGYDDLAIGYSWDTVLFSTAGTILVYAGGPDGPVEDEGLEILEPYDTFRLGYGGVVGADLDGDGKTEVVAGSRYAVVAYTLVDADGDGTFAEADCDDADPAFGARATELCDGLDNDCDGLVDESSPTWYADADGDGHGDPLTTSTSCTAPAGYVATGDDCDDGSALISPDGVELCDGVDDDCDGRVDEVGATDGVVLYADSDGDGAGGGAVTTLGCAAEDGWTETATDCDDGDATVYPGAAEVCDGVDQDCDGTVDEGATTTWHQDADHDGYGGDVSTEACTAPSGYLADATDCDDTSSAVHPGATETCDGVDQDCDGTIDDGGGHTFYVDADEDGYGSSSTVSSLCSTAPEGTATVAGDCDDGDAAVSPAATEVCNGADDDCDGTADDGLPTTAWYVDSDGDGLGGGSADVTCATPSGSVLVGGDCDDADASVGLGLPWYEDADDDGFGNPDESVVSCAQPVGWTDDATDCDDTDPDAYPGAAEVWYDGVDEACDEGDDDDQDGDGYAHGVDCDDTRASVSPGATEVWYDSVDEDCDGADDFDQDGDGQESATYGGTDCDDTDPDVYVGAPDTPYDGVVTDCDASDEYDRDGDGHDAEVAGGDDCDDGNSAVHPGATEVWYDGVDEDCAGDDDDDQDHDGVRVDDDCDDTDPTVSVCDTGSPDSGNGGGSGAGGGSGSGGGGDTGASGTGGGGDTADTGKPGDGGCGCVSGATGASWLGLGVGLVVLGRRRTR